jgi:hypothetical protein
MMNKMKKYWPIGLLVMGVLALVAVWFLVIRGKGGGAEIEEEEMVAEVPLEKRPVVSLTPRGDGHWLDMVIENVGVEAASLEYEILYQTATGITQGVPGMVKLKEGEKKIEREILLGSESSGKFRYDEGVEEGTLTLRFRDDKGKLVGKLMTDWCLLTGTKELAALDGKFSYTMKRASDEFFVVMETFGLPSQASLPGKVKTGPYGVFGSDDGVSGEVEMEGEVCWWSGKGWEKVSGTSEMGIFIGVSEVN